MKLSGSYQIKLEKQKVWEALNNPEILKEAIPGCEEFKKDFDENKAIVSKFAKIPSTKMRNVISGYVTRLMKKGD